MSSDNAVTSYSGQINSGAPTFSFNLAATTGVFKDGNGNEIVSGSKQTGSTNAATNHNYAGGGTPNLALAMVTGTATAWAAGTFTATQDTPAMTSAAAYTAYVSLI